jgi:hypothetical protein
MMTLGARSVLAPPRRVRSSRLVGRPTPVQGPLSVLFGEEKIQCGYCQNVGVEKNKELELHVF